MNIDVSKLKKVQHVVEASSDPMKGHMGAASTYEEGICNVCGKQMVATFAQDVPVFVCLQHRLVMPMKDFT